MLFIAFTAAIIASLFAALCVSWFSTYLFSIIGYDEHRPVFSYHCLTVPARIVAFCVTLASMCICAASWAYFITSLLTVL